MKILHLYAGNLYGGIETFLVTLARYRDLCPELIPEFGLCFRGRLWDELTTAGAVVHDLGEVRLSRPWTVWNARRRLRHVMLENRYDAVATHACWPHAVFASQVRATNTSLVHFGHDAITEISKIDRQAARTSPGLIIANSHYTASHCKTIFPNSPVEVVYLPVAKRDTGTLAKSVDDLRSEVHTDRSSIVILQVSRLERWKGAWKLIEALKLLKDDASWTAWIVGGVQRKSEQTYFNELNSEAARNGIADRIRFLGNRNDVPRVMASADIFCQANTGAEPFGITFIEAMHAGLPIVASDLGGPAEIVDATCGINVEAGDEVALAQSLRELIHDPVRRKELGIRGPSRASQLCDPARQLRAQYEAIATICSLRKVLP